MEASPGDISVGTNCNLASNVAAQASWPSGGNPGSTIEVNPCFFSTLNDAQRVRNMVHEIGHTLGFRHSNWQSIGESAGAEGAVYITGTPSGNDGASVMNGGTALTAWAGFSTGDRAAVSAVYPLPAPVATVSNSGGTPLLSWVTPAGAQSYDVTFDVLVRTSSSVLDHTEISLATTTGNQFLDSGNNFTGVSVCWVNDPETTSTTYRYRVTAHYPNGTAMYAVLAPVAEC